jgi:hypothetical protein
MKSVMLGIAVCLATAILAGGIWLERRHIDCKRRSTAFVRQIEDIERGANEELRVGADKAAVARFYEKRGIHFSVNASEATGTLSTDGCSPLGCGTDEALIGIRVKLNAQGTVIEAPQVVSLYTNCL